MFSQMTSFIRNFLKIAVRKEGTATAVTCELWDALVSQAWYCSSHSARISAVPVQYRYGIFCSGGCIMYMTVRYSGTGKMSKLCDHVFYWFSAKYCSL
jgi:hypothetical protein